jgi:hypothetical protein
VDSTARAGSPQVLVRLPVSKAAVAVASRSSRRIAVRRSVRLDARLCSGRDTCRWAGDACRCYELLMPTDSVGGLAAAIESLRADLQETSARPAPGAAQRAGCLAARIGDHALC